jgi:hypothetical protein
MGGDMGRVALITLVVGVLLSLLSLPAMAATLVVLQGPVSIREDQGFRPVTGSTEVYTDQWIYASLPGGNARIDYLDGCSIYVKPGTIVKVEGRDDPKSLAPCPKVAAMGPWPLALLAVPAVPFLIELDDDGGGKSVSR